MHVDIIAFAEQIANKLKSVYDDPTLRNQYAWWILEAILEKKQAELIAQGRVNLTHKQEKTIVSWLDKMITEHIPLQYLIGSVPFDDVDILVETPILIPRPETEEWVLWLIDQLNNIKNKQLHILDLACGSGCIAIALARHFHDAIIYATDINPQAIALTEKNIEYNYIQNVRPLTSDLFQAIPDGVQFDCIISNPPYINPTEWEKLDKTVTDWEDRNALIADDNGLYIIEQIITQAPLYLKPNDELFKKNIPQLVIEIDYDQGTAVEALLKKYSYNEVTVHKDLEGKDRFVSGRVDYVDNASTE